jgi:hypothetical protein
LFGLTFGGVWWWTGAGAATATSRPAAGPASAEAVAATVSLGEAAGELRAAVVRTAMGYRGSRCSHNAKARYITAATHYADEVMRAAGCRDYACGAAATHLEPTWRRVRTPEDGAVSEAMRAVNLMGGVAERDFPGDVGRAVRLIAGSDFGRGQSCVATVSRTWSPVVVGAREPDESRRRSPAAERRSSFRFRFRRR